MEGLIQVPCEKVDLEETSYQVVCRELEKKWAYIQYQYTLLQTKISTVIFISQI